MNDHDVFRLEMEILNGNLPDVREFSRLTAQSLEASPILSKAYGELLVRQGSLRDGLRLLNAAVKGLAVQGLQRHLLDAMSQLAMAHLRTGNAPDAATLLAFLREEFRRNFAEESGSVAHALAKGGYLIGERETQARYVQAAFDAYRQQPDIGLFAMLLMDLWAGMVPPDSLGTWEPQAAWMQQQHRLGNAPAVYSQFIEGMNHYHHGRWDEAVNVWNNTDLSVLGYFHSRIASAFYFRALCRSSSRKQQPRLQDMLRLERMLREDEADLELQFHAEMAKHEWCRLQSDKGGADESRHRAEILYQLVKLPSQQRELDALQNPGVKAAVQATSALRIYCFGGLRFVHNRQETRELLWKRKKTKELLLYLLIQPRFRVPRDQAAELLFGDDETDKVANRLYVVIHELKSMFKTWFGIPDAVFLKEGIVRMDESMIEYLDLEEYMTLTRVGEQLWRQDPELSLEMFEKACQLYDDFLPDMAYLDWLEQYREMLARTQAGMLKRLSQHAAAKGHFDRADSYVTEWLRVKPLQEEAHHEKIALLIKMGRKTDAKHWYDNWEQICRKELGSQPMPELRKLVFGGA